MTKNSSYEEFLTKDGSVSINHRNIQALATEFYKIKNGLQLGGFANGGLQLPQIFAKFYFLCNERNGFKVKNNTKLQN